MAMFAGGALGVAVAAALGPHTCTHGGTAAGISAGAALRILADLAALTFTRDVTAVSARRWVTTTLEADLSGATYASGATAIIATLIRSCALFDVFLCVWKVPHLNVGERILGRL